MVLVVFMILFAVVGVGLFSYATYRMTKLVKNPLPKTNDYPKEIRLISILDCASGVAIGLCLLFYALSNKFSLGFLEYTQLIGGGFLFGFAVSAFIHIFVIHYYCKEKSAKLDDYLFKCMLISALLALLGIIFLTNGIADHIEYPLVNGISFSKGLVTPASGGSPNIAWYAFCILGGALLCYFILDHRLYREYGKHGIAESTFLVAFPAGIIGARIGYVIGEWNHGPNSFAERVANGQWWAPLAIWEGGLTIISGALIGIIVGVIWYMWRNKKYSIWVAVDIIVPCILIAQAVGRWGNFFNCEVHGNQSPEQYWSWLPKIIFNNIHYSESHGFADSGYVWVPLFFIECMTNLAGYFVIRYAVGKGLRKYMEPGDLCFLYVFWYGLTRVLMEPLRDASYNMGNDGYWSWFWSFVFVTASALCICVNHIVRYLLSKKNGTYILQKNSLMIGGISSSVLLVIALGLMIPGIVLMATGESSKTIAFNQFNNGLILLMLGLAALLLLGITLPYIIEGLKKEKAKA